MSHRIAPPVQPTPWPPPVQPVDIKAFVKNLAARPASDSANAGQYRRTARLVEPAPRRVVSRPLAVLGWLDGIQARCVAGRVDHRDITLAYVAAGTVLDTTLLSVEERLATLCCITDEARVRSALSEMPVVAFPEVEPWTLALVTDEWIDSTRRFLEFEALTNAPARRNHYVVVDGSLPPETDRADAIGVVKRCLDTDWMDSSLLPPQGGWRSPALLLPAGRAGERDRLTAFVRLREATGNHPWGFSLIRVETFAESGLAVLDAAAALAISQRQHRGSGDPRWEIQLAGMYRTEQLLKARSPFALEALS